MKLNDILEMYPIEQNAWLKSINRDNILLESYIDLRKSLISGRGVPTNGKDADACLTERHPVSV